MVLEGPVMEILMKEMAKETLKKRASSSILS